MLVVGNTKSPGEKEGKGKKEERRRNDCIEGTVHLRAVFIGHHEAYIMLCHPGGSQD